MKKEDIVKFFKDELNYTVLSGTADEILSIKNNRYTKYLDRYDRDHIYLYLLYECLNRKKFYCTVAEELFHDSVFLYNEFVDVCEAVGVNYEKGIDVDRRAVKVNDNFVMFVKFNPNKIAVLNPSTLIISKSDKVDHEDLLESIAHFEGETLITTRYNRV